MTRRIALVALLAWSQALAVAPSGTLPDRDWPAETLYQRISPDLGHEVHNQPSVVNGYLMLAGNASHQLWDISDPTAPVMMSAFAGPHGEDEAESHSVAFRKTADGRHQAVTISGKGVDLWDLTDAAKPVLLKAHELEGIDYGDNTNAVWGLFWQGDVLYVGGTNTGLHIVDTRVPEEALTVARLPTGELGGVSAGPLFAIGNLLVVTTPKKGAGIATLDIGDPLHPVLLDAELPSTNSYIGGMYGRFAYLLHPFRSYDVTTDPTNIQLVGSVETPETEYMSFGDGFLFLGALRPNQGIYKIPFGDVGTLDLSRKIEGRRPDELLEWFTDDQFSLPVGNLLVISDDEVDIGSTIAVHDTARDTQAPRALYGNPVDGATLEPLTSRVGISFSDQIDLRSVDTSTFVVRPLSGGPALPGSFGHVQTFVSFWPEAALEANTTYEVVLPAGGIKDLAGNGLESEFRSVFATGTEVAAPPCHPGPQAPVVVGAEAGFEAAPAGPQATYVWDFGDGTESAKATSPAATHAYAGPGRYPVTLTVTQGDSTSGSTRRCAATRIVFTPPAAVVPSHSSPVVVDAASDQVLVVNPDADTVTSIDSNTFAVRFEAPVAAHPASVTTTPASEIWVACRDGDAVTVLEPEEGATLAEIALPWGSQPGAIATASGGERVVVVLQATAAVAIVDASSRSVVTISEAALGDEEQRPLLGGVSLADDQALVTRFVSPADRGEVLRLTLDDFSSVEVLTLGRFEGPDRANGGRGVPNYLAGVAVSPDGRSAVVPAKLDNTERGPVRDGQPLNTTNTVRTGLAFLDLGTGLERADARVDLDDHNMATAAIYSPLGDLVFVATMGSNKVDVLNAHTGSLVAGFSVGLGPRGLALAEGKLFVQDALDRTLSVFDVSGLLAGTDTAAFRLARVPTVEIEPLSPEVLLGKQLFYNAANRQISQDGYISCGGCHVEGGEDGRVWDFTNRGEGLRNTIDLRGRAGTGHGPVHWTANFDEIQDFENDIRTHFGGSGLMTDADFSAEDRSAPLGAQKAGISTRLDALAAFVASLDRFPRSPFRNADGSRTDAADAGADLFRALDCLDCHASQRLTDSAAGTRHDVGTFTPASGQRRGGMLDGLDTPTLRGIWATAPYLHDGSAASVRATLQIPGHGNAPLLTDADMDALVAFLLQLENEDVNLERLPPYVRPPEPEPGADLAGSDVGSVPDAAPTEVPATSGGCSQGAETGASAPWIALMAFFLFCFPFMLRRPNG